MSLFQALRYFVATALRSLRRGWQEAALAVIVTATSLAVAGGLGLLANNVTSRVADWESTAKIVVFLELGTSEEGVATLTDDLVRNPWIESWKVVSPEEGAARLEKRLPDLAAEALQEAGTRLPTTIELILSRQNTPAGEFEDWLVRLRQHPAVELVVDDARWLRQLRTLGALLHTGALTLGSLLLIAAGVVIASVIRLAAMIRREEIRVLRLVGATEFFVRGPFVAEGLLQGLFGALLALLMLFAGYRLLGTQQLPSLVSSVFLGEFLPRWQQAALVGAGAVAGLVGGLLSLRRSGELW